MSSYLKKFYHQFIFGLAVVGLALSCLWLWQQRAALRRLRSMPVVVKLSGSRYEVARLLPPEPTDIVWPEPAAQSSGPDWIYEVFSPPAIYYNLRARRLTVVAPRLLREEEAPLGVELLAVQPEPYRIQLVGYIGAPGDSRAVMVSPNQPATFLVRAGERVAGLGLTLQSFAVQKVLAEHSATGPIYEIAALAVVRDERTGVEVRLDSRVRKYTDTPLAVLQSASGLGPARELHAGDIFADESSSYRVERVSLDPPEVLVVRMTPGGPPPETQVLHPIHPHREKFAARTSAANSFPAQLTGGLNSASK